MANNDRFRTKFAKRIEKSKDKSELFIKKLVVEIDKRLTEKSPVGNPSLWKSPPPPGYVGGRFKNNWVVGNGSVNFETNQGLSSTPFGAYDNKNALEINLLKVNGQIIYITNALPYAKRLETGYSGQAPAGMVGITLAEINSVASKIAIELRMV